MPRKLTPRQVAARNARAARGPLSSEGRAKLRAAALARRPWKASTGPRTAAGKSRSRENALKHGRRLHGLIPPLVRWFERRLRQALREETPVPVVPAVRPLLLEMLNDRCAHVCFRAYDIILFLVPAVDRRPELPRVLVLRHQLPRAVR